MNFFKNILIVSIITLSLFATSLLIQNALKMYQNNTLIENPKIIKKLEKSAKNNDIDASFLLATIYKNGKTGVVDYDKSFIWYKNAAKLGDSDAMLMLGWIYYEGKISQGTNIEKAKYWFSQAANLGVEEAVEMLNILNA
ncbi:MAG: tetratricopeptide repeat protein [Campylobacterota bacterium]|nr:tetratricopeptide repeat protein [Campylobacterota bacterium]